MASYAYLWHEKKALNANIRMVYEREIGVCVVYELHMHTLGSSAHDI